MFAKCLPVFVGALLLAGCGKKDDPPPGQPFTPPQMPGMPGGPGTPKPPAVDLKSAKPDATYTRVSFEEAMAKEKNFPMSKHGGKVIELKSVVQGYGGNHDNKPRLALADKPNAAAGGIEGYAIVGGMPVSSAFPTQTVILRAFVDPAPNSLAPYEWHLVGVEGPPPPTITAAALVKERAADDLKFEEKYKFKYIFVTGTVAKFEYDRAKISTLELETGAELGTLVCLIDGFFRDVTPKQLASLNPGAKVKVLGRVSAVGLDGGLIFDPAP